MLCKHPISIRPPFLFPCGQCLHCRINRRRLWTNRILLESKCHKDATFVTLTYNNESLPPRGSLVPKHLTDFLKRLRFHTGLPLRYFAVGEYGDVSKRPHYHICLFGFPNCFFGGISVTRNPTCDCNNCRYISRIWGKGNIALGQVAPDSIQYVAGYTLKKLTKFDDERLKNADGTLNYPEFTRMSLKPGIGYPFLEMLKASNSLQTVRNYSELRGDVPSVFRIGEKPSFIGRYLKNKLRGIVLNVEKIENQIIDPEDYQMYRLYFVDEINKKRSPKTYKKYIIDKNQNKMNSIEYLHNIKQKVKKI